MGLCQTGLWAGAGAPHKMRKSSLWAVLGSLPSLQGRGAWEARKELATEI